MKWAAERCELAGALERWTGDDCAGLHWITGERGAQGSSTQLASTVALTRLTYSFMLSLKSEAASVLAGLRRQRVPNRSLTRLTSWGSGRAGATGSR